MSESERLARIEAKIDSLIEVKNDTEKRVRSLEKKWWTSLGAFFIALGGWLKSLYG